MDPFFLFAAALAAGVVSHGEREAAETQRRRALESVLHIRRPPSRWFTLSPWPFIREYVLASEDPREDDGIWHVTTDLTSVIRDGVLPRSKTGKIGLGGGPSHQAPDQVSTVPRRYAAVRLYQAMRDAVKAARNELSAADVVESFLWQNDAAISQVLDHESMSWDEEDEDPGYDLGEHLALAIGERSGSIFDIELMSPQVRERLEWRFSDGKSKYELLMRLEDELLSALMESQERMEDLPTCNSPVGFTAPWERFVQISPDQLGIVRLAADKRAVVDVIPSECEVRFHPDDLFVVGYEVPA